MVLQDVAVGQNAYIELEWLEKYFNIPTKIVAVSEMGVVVEPYRYKGELIDFSNAQEINIIFNLHYISPETHLRVTWKNINIKGTIFKGRQYYLIKPNVIRKLAYEDERRANHRIPLDYSATVTDKTSSEAHLAKMYDMNSAGIAFTMDSEEVFKGNQISVHISDKARNRDFDFDVDCKIIRKVKDEDKESKQVLYGCRIINPDNKMLAYLFMKRMDHRLEEKMMQS